MHLQCSFVYKYKPIRPSNIATGAAYCPETETRCNGECIPDMDHDCIHDETVRE